MKLLRFLIILLASFSVSACAEESQGVESPNAVNSELARMANELSERSGQTVTVRGYLADYAPTLVLVENEESNVFQKPVIVVMDINLRELTRDNDEFIDESQYLASLGCRDKYVELTGEVGFLPVHEVYGIMRIETIVTFSDGSYGGEAEICYAKN